MNRYEIREVGKRTGPLSFNKFNLKDVKEDIDLLHYYDTKLKVQTLYEVYDTKLHKIIYKEEEVN